MPETARGDPAIELFIQSTYFGGIPNFMALDPKVAREIQWLISAYDEAPGKDVQTEVRKEMYRRTGGVEEA